MNVIPSQRRRRANSIAAETSFRSRIAELGGLAVGEYVNNRTPVHVKCADGHDNYVRPDNILIGQGICRPCAGIDKATAEKLFYSRIVQRGARVVGSYVNAYTPVHVVCEAGHDCYPWPTSIQQRQGLCRVCAGRDPVTTQAAVCARVAELGGRVVGPYVDTATPLRIICAAGHDCSPRPTDILRGCGICCRCKGKAWDIFYVVANPAEDLVKVGITSLDRRRRLSSHRRNGYTDVIQVLPGMPDAHLLERHLLSALHDAGVSPVQGREYFPAAALALVLDIVDGWDSPL